MFFFYASGHLFLQDLSFLFYISGLENEGWFDPWLLLQALRNKATSLGTQYVKGEVVGFNTDDYRMLGYDGNVQIRKRLESVKVMNVSFQSH